MEIVGRWTLRRVALLIALLACAPALAGCDLGGGEEDGETRASAPPEPETTTAGGIQIAVADVRLEETLQGRHGRTFETRPGETFLLVVTRLRNPAPEGGLEVHSRRAVIVDDDGKRRRASGGGEGKFCLCEFLVSTSDRTGSFTFVFEMEEPLPRTLSFRYGRSDPIPLRLPRRARPGAPSTAAQADWMKITPGGRTACARGGKYAFWFRRGSPEKLLVYFQAGGGCFDVRTCSRGSPFFDDSVSANDDPRGEDGILDLARPDNPFRDYSVLYIPSCTGDVHWGNNVRTYREGGREVTIHHGGFINARAALAWVYERVRSPKNVFVTGCSAGSVGSAAFAPFVIERYERARVTQLGDSLAFVFHRPLDLQEDYRAHANFPPWIAAVRRIEPGSFTMARYYAAIARHYPDMVFSQFNYAGDRVQRLFYEAVGGDGDDFRGALARSLDEIRHAAPNFRCYTSEGDGHCVLNGRDFYTHETGGVRLRDWVAGLAAGRQVADVGKP